MVEQLDKISLSFLTGDLEVAEGSRRQHRLRAGWPRPGPDPRRRGRRGLRRLPVLAPAARRRHHLGALSESSAHRAVHLHDRQRPRADRDLLRRRHEEARRSSSTPIAERVGGIDLVVIGANDPEAMPRHTEERRQRGSLHRRPHAAARLLRRRRHPPAGRRRELPLHQRVRGRTSPSRRPGGASRRSWSGSAPGSRHAAPRASGPPQGRGDDQRPVAPEERSADPTGVGDAFRAGFITASPRPRPRPVLRAGLACSRPTSSRPWARRSTSSEGHFLDRLTEAYGPDAVAEIEPHIVATAPTRPDPDRSTQPRSEPPGAHPAALDQLGPVARPARRATTSSASAPTSRPARSTPPTRAGVPDGHRRPRRPTSSGGGRLTRAACCRSSELRVPGPCGSRWRTSRCGSTPPSTRSSPRAPTRGREGRWIRPRSRGLPAAARAGWAHSVGLVETWQRARLSGGLYGVAIGGLFAGESMFHGPGPRRLQGRLVALVDLLAADDDPPADRRAVGHRAPGHAGVSEVSREDYLRALPDVLSALPLPAPRASTSTT